MKLLILSDLHAEFETFEVSKDVEYDVAVLAGDIVAPGRVAARWLRSPARFGDKPVIQIAGNHEYYGSVLDQELAEMRRQAREHDVQFLECDETVIGGVRFLGCTLWTDFRLRINAPGFAGQPVRLLSDRDRSMTECSRYLADYSAIRVDDPKTSSTRGTRRLVPMDTLQIYRRHRSWLRRKLAEPFHGPTVVVTHHAPHRNSLAPRFAEDWASGGFVNEMLPDFDLDKLEQDLPTLAAQVFGAEAQTWLDKPHELLEGQTPAEFAAAGGLEKVRSILNSIQHGGVA